MNNISNECGLCGNKSKRLCPGLDKMICSSCCGSKRGTGIACSADCKYYPFNINGYDLWLRRGESKKLEKKMLPSFRHEDESEGVGTLANVSLYPNQLIIETFTMQKYTFAKKMVDKYFAGMVTLKNEKVVDIAKQVAGRTGEEE